jgi:hypothetical protein
MEENVMEFLAGFNGSAWSDWLTFACFVAIPVGLVSGWCWESWRTRNYTERDWRDMGEKR